MPCRRRSLRYTGGPRLSSLTTWMYRILLDCCYDAIRRRRHLAEGPAPAQFLSESKLPLNIAINSVRCSYDSGYRSYNRTHKMINSPGCCRPLKGLFGVIGIDFYPINLPAAKFATKPREVCYAAIRSCVENKNRSKLPIARSTPKTFLNPIVSRETKSSEARHVAARVEP
jgi:hypothetical protein